MKTEEVELAKIVQKNGTISFKWCELAGKKDFEVLYFLESYVKVQREEYEQAFTTDKRDE